MDEEISQVESPPLALNSCLSCKSGKRRVGRNCAYEEDTLNFPASSGFQQSQTHSHLHFGKSGSRGGTLSPGGSSSQVFSSSFGTASEQQVDPFLHDALRKPTVDIALSMEVSNILGAVDKVHAMAIAYFETIWTRMPMICKSNFFKKLPTMYDKPQADFLLLCLCIHLYLQTPAEGVQSMQSSLYVNVKSKISLLESTSYLTRTVIQARILVTSYEMGHGINPGATISISACASSARALGLNKKAFQNPASVELSPIQAEEEKRVWWAVVVLDRFVNLCQGSALFATEDPHADDHLPLEDTLWAQEILPAMPPSTLATPSNITVGPFARECQVSHLAGRVLSHVINPTSDPAFHQEEALQLERTLRSFMPLLVEEQSKYGLYCAAFGICVK
ncbi:hypothetical protein LSUE1_G004366 [Lachnellula suecica]|uniref:Xylanolytic transcriptional activator regulatory domain-containing protein n=1 Tax=Lachnellula suecica TaxID=602035 RepID=A0A8T9C5Q0_9HELO|nr:hypothetical protein LSUE1_G004366 [Lachnellula suecica]